MDINKAMPRPSKDGDPAQSAFTETCARENGPKNGSLLK
jgi:hypothetical protein